MKFKFDNVDFCYQFMKLCITKHHFTSFSILILDVKYKETYTLIFLFQHIFEVNLHSCDLEATAPIQTECMTDVSCAYFE